MFSGWQVRSEWTKVSDFTFTLFVGFVFGSFGFAFPLQAYILNGQKVISLEKQ